MLQPDVFCSRLFGECYGGCAGETWCNAVFNAEDMSNCGLDSFIRDGDVAMLDVTVCVTLPGAAIVVANRKAGMCPRASADRGRIWGRLKDRRRREGTDLHQLYLQHHSLLQAL